MGVTHNRWLCSRARALK